MNDGTHRHNGISVAVIAAGLIIALCSAPSALAVDPPHVPDTVETDACAMCHRGHTASSDATWTAPPIAAEAGRSSLLLGTPAGTGDTGMCFTCHGVDALGSTIDVQSAFTSESSHTIAPFSSEYGPSLKQCGSCHDSHGSARTLAGDPYPALLRSRSLADPNLLIYAGAAYCGTCHANRVADTWDGLDVWGATAHSMEITAPASGTGIVCSACHEPHGSNNPPNVRELLYPPAVTATITIAANDRTLCYACHTAASSTYSGSAVYETAGFGVSESTVTAVGEWASAEDTRTVGECQNCHAPMGSSDGFGNAVPKLAEKPGRELCDTCHSPSSETSQTAVDMVQFKFPVAETSKPEVAVCYDAERLGAVFDRLALYAQETTGTLPFELIGPREYDIPGRSSDMSYGDVQGDGVPELVVADPTAHRLVLAAASQLSGVATSVPSPNVDATPTLVAVGDIFVDATARPEIAMISRDDAAPFASRLHIYRYQAGGLVSLVSTATGTDATGLALGGLGGTAGTDIVVTSAGDDSLRIYTESVVTSGTLAAPTVVATGLDPRGPSIGDADSAAAGNEIAVALRGEAVNTMGLYASDGTFIGSYAAAVAAGALAWDTLIADVLPGVPGKETIVALRSTVGDSGVNLFDDVVGAGLDPTPLSYVTGAYFATSSLAAGDVDSDQDARDELVVANAGKWAFDTTTRRAPSIQVFRANAAGDALAAPQTYSSAGVEMAGNTPGLVVADLRAVGRTRHPTSVVSGAHVSTETAPFTRHVECTDCHNVHEATSTVAAAPLVYGRLKGAWGVGFDNYTYAFREGVVNEYEVCFKCHSDYDTTQVPAGSAEDIRSQVDTRNASFHPVMGASTVASNTAGSFVAGWTSTSRTYCKDCHGNNVASEPTGPHASNAAPLLTRPYWGESPSTATGLCYKCHKQSVYYTGVDDYPAASASNFYDVNRIEPKLHTLHVMQRGYRCDTCHVGHGGTLQHMLKPGLSWAHTATGGSCTVACHSGTTGLNVYNRAAVVDSVATSYTVAAGTYVSGDTQSTRADDTDYLVVNEGGILSVDFSLDNVSAPQRLTFIGSYSRNGGLLTFHIWNWSTSAWVAIPGAIVTGDAAATIQAPAPWAIAAGPFVRDGRARIGVQHSGGGGIRQTRVDYIAVGH